MKCISIPQPWAWAILAGLHRVDYRCGSTDYRGDVLLYANAEARAWDRQHLEQFGESVPDWEDLLVNRVIGVVDLYDCQLGSEGEWGWCLREPRAVIPFWIRPGRGLFEVSAPNLRIVPSHSRSRSRRRAGLVHR